MEKFHEFSKDFGFVEEHRADNKIYYRGYGKDPYVYVALKSRDGRPRFKGPAFVAASQEDFDKAAKLVGAKIGSLDRAPSVGRLITFERPDDIFFHVVYGQQEREIGTEEPSATVDEQGPLTGRLISQDEVRTSPERWSGMLQVIH